MYSGRALGQTIGRTYPNIRIGLEHWIKFDGLSVAASNKNQGRQAQRGSARGLHWVDDLKGFQ